MYSTMLEHAQYYGELARTQWFKDHVVSINTYQCGNISPVVVVDFRRPNTNMYAVRYVFDGFCVYVSGDLGDAVFHCTWKTKPVDKVWKSLWYVFEKLSASEDGRTMDYDSSVCVTTIKRELEMDTDGCEKEGETPYPEDWNEEQKETYLALINSALDCSTMDQWSHAIQELTTEHELYKISSDWWEWLYGAGKVMPPRIVGMITGLQIVSEKLGEDRL